MCLKIPNLVAHLIVTSTLLMELRCNNHNMLEIASP